MAVSITFTMLSKSFLVLAFLVDLIALLFVIYAAYDLLISFFRLTKKKKKKLSNKEYHEIRSVFVNRIILALDFFIAADMVKLVFISTIDNLVQILLIVIIRTVLSQFLLKEIQAHK